MGVIWPERPRNHLCDTPLVRVTYLLVRHGEAEGNREHRFIGQTDVPLSDLGVLQANAVSRRLGEIPVNAIIASDLQRASNTVAPLADSLGLTIEHDPRLREIANGEWNGLLPTEISERWPDLWARYRGGEDVTRPGGEQWVDVQARAVAALQADSTTRDDGDVVVVATHGGPILGVVTWVAGLSLKQGLFNGPFAPVSNASITSIELPTRRIRSVNDVGHLGELARTMGSPFGR